MNGVTVGAGVKPVEPARVFLTPPGGEPLALYAERIDGGAVTLACGVGCDVERASAPASSTFAPEAST